MKQPAFYCARKFLQAFQQWRYIYQAYPSKAPFPLLPPCHRGICGTGGMMQFGGGKTMKEERVARNTTTARKRVDSALWIIPD
jgi:hypothetical protein